MFVTLDGERASVNIWERHKMEYICRMRNENNGRNRKITIRQNCSLNAFIF